jgi:hypothetical protein
MNDDYLWDGSGSPDPEVERMEKLLVRFRGSQRAPEFPEVIRERQPAPAQRLAWVLSMAAAILLAACAAWYARVWFRHDSWTVSKFVGSPQIDGHALRQNGHWRAGGLLETDATSRAELEMRGMGQLEIEPNSQVALLEATADHQQFRLERGEIRAVVNAPPYVFLVHTPTAYAMDMGCAYTLHVDDDGTSLLRVTVGWVDLQRGWRQSLVPEGAAAESRPDIGPGAPYYQDATERFRQALEIVNFDESDAKARSAALTMVLSEARKRDAFTLLNLFNRVDEEDRGRVYDRLASLVPPPPGVTREDAVNDDSRKLGPWWDLLGIGHAKKGFKSPPRIEE